MRSQITVLDEITINKIAAGEVVDNPSSVVKELVENSIDAGSKQITIEIVDGGKQLIKVSDDGDGIEEAQIPLAFKRHATSKIKSIDDISYLNTNGFRGEALSSISSVAEIEVITNTSDEGLGKKATISNSTVQEVIDFGSRKGTTIYVRDIFKNIPARRKFLKTTVKENNSIIDIVNRLAIINSNIKFKLISDGKVLLSTEGDGSLLNAVRVVYGKNVSTNLVELCYKDENVSIFGYVSNTSLYASNRKKQNVFVNKRYIKLGTLNYSIEGAYKEIIPIGKYPIFILDIEINPQMIDPNVHPAKTEVKIDSEMNLEKLVGVLVREKLFKSSHNLIPEYTAPENKISAHIAVESASSQSETQGYASPKEHSFSTELARENSEVTFSPAENTSSDTKKNDTKENLFVYNESEVVELNEALKEEKVERHEEKKLDEIEVPFSKLLQEMTHKKEVQPQVSHNNGDAQVAETKVESVKAEPPVQIQVSEVSQDSQALQSFEALKPKAEEILDYNEFFVSGVVFETYILATYKDNMYLIDQHAAHERVMYEKFMKQYDLNKYSPEASFESQELLIPIIKELTMDEYSVVIEHLDIFKLFGIEVDDFGFGKIVMRSLPLIFSEAQTEAFVDEIIDIISSESELDLNDKFRDKLATMACKKAIKANQKIEAVEIKSLFNRLNECDNKYTCPHGRPIFVKFTKYEIEKMFKRVNA